MAIHCERYATDAAKGAHISSRPSPDSFGLLPTLDLGPGITLYIRKF